MDWKVTTSRRRLSNAKPIPSWTKPNDLRWKATQPIYYFLIVIFFFFSFTCRGVSENDQDIYSFCFKSKQLYNQYLNDCVNDADLAENLASTFQTWYFFKLSSADVHARGPPSLVDAHQLTTHCHRLVFADQRVTRGGSVQ